MGDIIDPTNGADTPLTPDQKLLMLAKRFGFGEVPDDATEGILITLSPTKGIGIAGSINNRVTVRGLMEWVKDTLRAYWQQQDVQKMQNHQATVALASQLRNQRTR